MTLEEWLAAAPKCIPFDLRHRLKIELGYVPVIVEICEQHGVQVDDVTGNRRSKNIIAARRACVRALRALGIQYETIGRILNRHHASVMNLASGKQGRVGWDERRVA